MKSLGKLLCRCLLVAAGFMLALMIVFVSVLVGVGIQELRNYPYSEHQIAEIAEALQKKGSNYVLHPSFSQEQWLQGYEWAMLLNEDGRVVWQYQLPTGFKRRYSVSEVAGFSRWYLNDYPVFVWRCEPGLLVLAKQKGSVWKYNFYSTPGAVSAAVQSGLRAIGAVILIAVIISGVWFWRFWRSVRRIGEGMDALARGTPIFVEGRGITAELAEQLNQTGRILQHQNELLEKRDTARTQWIAGVSHDIRTPLSLVLGYAEQLEQEQSATESVRCKGNAIRIQCQKMRSLIEDLNLTSKLQYHAQPLRCAKIQVGPLLRAVTADFCNSTVSERCETVFLITREANDAIVNADRALLTRALDNLLINCAEHNLEECTVTISARCLAGMLEITVEDNGAGYPQAVLSALRGEAQEETTPHILGLYLVRQIVEAHGGKVIFGQHIPSGAKAILLIPLAEKENGI